MVDQMRTCRRTACRWPAMASLAFRYATRQVWLTDLVTPPHPAVWDLCPYHADTLTVPRGWDRVDERTTTAAPVEPAGRDLIGDSPPVVCAASPHTGGGAAQQRHEMPVRRASAPSDVSAHVPATVGAARGGEGSSAGEEPRMDRYAPLRAALPLLAAELAREDRPPAPPAPADLTRSQVVVDPPLPPMVDLPGQLRLPLEVRGTGVVVPIDAAATRRREL